MAETVLQSIKKKMWMRLNLNTFLIICFLNVLSAQENFEKDSALRHFMQGEYFLNQGNYAMAILELQEALQLDPNASTIHVSIADGYRKLGKYNRAESHLGIAIELNPEEIEAIEMLAQIKINKQDYSEAENLYLSLNKLNPDNVDYIFMLADLAKLKKEWEQSIDYYIEAFKINSFAISGLEQALQIALTTSKFLKAEEVCDILVENKPDNIELLETLRDLTIYNGRYLKSLEVLGKIEKLDGISLDIYIQKSSLYEELGNDMTALEIIYKAYELDSSNIDVLQRMVTLLMNQEKNEEAIFYNQKIIDNYPDDSRGFINNAVMSMSSKKPEEAIKALRPYADRFSEDFTVQYLLGTAYYQLKDYFNSKIFLSNALRIFPQSRNTKHNLALIYDSNGEWEESDKLYMELISSDTTDAQAFNNFAYSLVERDKDVEFALELAQNAIRLEPRSAAYLDTIGWIYFKMNEYDEALHYIKESLSIDASNQIIQDHLNQVIKTKAEVKNKKIPQANNQD